MIIDTHTHIYTEEFDTDRADVVTRAREAGVGILLLPNINAASVAPLLDTCRRWPDICVPLIGLHPEDVREDYATVLEEMKKKLQCQQVNKSTGQQVNRSTSQQVNRSTSQQANKSTGQQVNRSIDGQTDHIQCDVPLTCGRVNPFIGIGEVGLDFYWDTTYKAEQMKAFEQQLDWAVEYHLPVIIHQRAAFDELYALMESFRDKALTGIFHCFGGTAEEAEKLLSFPGFALGIGGTVTYKKSTLPDVLQTVVPLERIVVETDAPYLAPVPHRGKRNEPAFIVEVVKRLATLYDTTPEAVANQTTATAIRLFPTLTN